MTAVIVANDTTGGSTSPDLVLGYQTARHSRNLVHDLIGGGIAVSLIAPRLRSGVLNLFYRDEADGWAGLALHSRESSFTLTDTDVPEIGMSYVLSDGADLELQLDPDTLTRWLLNVPYQEIVP